MAFWTSGFTAGWYLEHAQQARSDSCIALRQCHALTQHFIRPYFCQKQAAGGTALPADVDVQFRLYKKRSGDAALQRVSLSKDILDKVTATLGV